MIQDVHNAILAKKITVATAESCTGGALAARFVTQPGASNYFVGGIVAYNNWVKETLLDVDPKLLETQGAVSEEVTAQMALHVSQKLRTTLGIAVSGILGPTGGDKPIGTVSVSFAYGGKVALSWTMHHTGNRLEILDKVLTEILQKLHNFLLTDGA